MRVCAGLLVLFLAAAVSRVEAQLASAELYVNVSAATNATEEHGTSDPQPFNPTPRTENVS